jgi:nucleoside-diphosphate-sugar epimerase
MIEEHDIVILGFGYTGRAVAKRATAVGLRVIGTVRSEAREAALKNDGFDVVRAADLDAALIAPWIGPKTRVVVSFPPDGATERAILPALRGAAHVTFISTTGVYGATVGRVDDETPIPAERSKSTETYLAAEALFRELGGTTLRCPGIYGADRGLHVRVVSGLHKIPGDGSRATSRIHVDDLAAFVMAAPRAPGETFVVGDLTPGPHGETVRWIAETYGVPMPPSVPIESVHESLRGDRRVDPSRALRVLGVELAFPTYQLGMSPAATGLRAAPP